MILRSRRTWSQLGLCVLSLAVASCASGPFAGVNPRDLGVPTAGANQGLEIRLNGTATLNQAPFPDASLKVFDLLSGDEVTMLTINASDEAVPAPAGTKFETDKQARFNYGLKNLDTAGIYKVVAAKGDVVMTSLFDGQGRALGKAATSAYKLQQTATGNRRVSVSLNLSLETTLAAKAFEGVAKLNGLSSGDNDALFRAMDAALPRIVNRLRDNPKLVEDLSKQLDPSGEIKDPNAFKKLVDDSKLTDDLGPEVDKALEDAAKRPPKGNNGVGNDGVRDDGTTPGKRGPVTEEDFPLGKVKVDPEKGQITFDDGKGKTFSANVPTDKKGNNGVGNDGVRDDGTTPGNGQRPGGQGGAGGAGDDKDKGNNGVGPDGVRDDGTKPPGLGGPQGGNLDAGNGGAGGAGGRNNRNTTDPFAYTAAPTIFVTSLDGENESAVETIEVRIVSSSNAYDPADNRVDYSAGSLETLQSPTRTFTLPTLFDNKYYYVQLTAKDRHSDTIGVSYHVFYRANGKGGEGLHLGLMIGATPQPDDRILDASGTVNVIGSGYANVRRVDAYLLAGSGSPKNDQLWARLVFDGQPSDPETTPWQLRLPSILPNQLYTVRLKAYDASGRLLSDNQTSLSEFETTNIGSDGILFDLVLGNGGGAQPLSGDVDGPFFGTGWVGSLTNPNNEAIQFNNKGSNGEIKLHNLFSEDNEVDDPGLDVTLSSPHSSFSNGVVTFEEFVPASSIPAATWTVKCTLAAPKYKKVNKVEVMCETDPVASGILQGNSGNWEVFLPDNTGTSTSQVKTITIHKR
jgi:hypothetical protein